MIKKYISIFLIIFLLIAFNNSYSLKVKSSTNENFYRLEIYNMTRREAISLYVKAHQVEGGGIVSSLDVVAPYPGESFFAVFTLKIINKLNVIDANELLKYIMSVYNGTIFFEEPGQTPKRGHVWMITVYRVVRVLDVIGGLDMIDKDSLINWVLRMQDPDTGLFYSRWVDGKRENLYMMDGTVFAILLLDFFDALDRIDRDKVIKSFYEEFYDEEIHRFGDFIFIGFPIPNMWGIMAMKVLGGLNDSIIEDLTSSILEELNWWTGMSIYSSNVDESWALLYSLYLLGNLDKIDGNRSVETVLSLQDHTYGGFYAGDYPDNEISAGIRVTYSAVSILDLFNATYRLDEPFYIEKIPKYYGGWPNVDTGTDDNDGLDFPSLEEIVNGEGNSSLLDLLIALTVVFGIGIIIVAPFLYIIDRKVGGKKGKINVKKRKVRRFS